MSMWALLPVVLGSYVISKVALSKAKPVPPVPPVPANFVPQQPLSWRSWPWTAPDSLLWAYSSTVSANGSTNALDIQQFAPDQQSNSLLLTMPQGTILKVGPSGTGYVYLAGSPQITASWSVMTSNGSVAMTKTLSSAYFTVPIARLVSTITLACASQKASSVPTLATVAQLWTDEFSRPTFGQYVMQPFLESSNALSLHITELNRYFDVTVNGSTTTVDLLQETESTTPMTPDGLVDGFMGIVQRALASQIPGNSSNSLVNYSLESVDTLRPSMLHLARSYWYGSAQFTITMPTDAVKADATAATFGHYSRQNQSAPAVIDSPAQSSLNGSSYVYISNGPCIIQWPLTYTVLDYEQPGSADTDGLVVLSRGNEPVLSFNASEFPYSLYGPVTSVNSDSSFIINGSFAFVPSSLQIEADNSGPGGSIVFASTKVKITQFEITNTPDWQALCATLSSVTVRLTSNGSAVNFTGLLTSFWTNIGTTEAYCSLKNSLGPFTFTPNTLMQTGLEPIPVKIEILQGSTVVCTSETTVVFTTSTHRAFRASDATDTFSQQLKALFSTTAAITIDAWAGGGGSMLDENPVKFGGASGHVTATVEPSTNLQRIDIVVGQAGSRDSQFRCTGGKRTSVTVDSNVLFDIGGGGGAAQGSHGGAGGAPRDTRFDPTQDSVFPGYSASLQTFTVPATEPLINGPPFTFQVEGPIAKPAYGTASPGTIELIQIFQGSGAGPSEPGKPGYYLVGSQEVMGYDGGTGGLGYGPEGPMSGGTGGRQNTNYAGIPGPYGGGGGGTTWVHANATFETFQLTIECIQPPWLAVLPSGAPPATNNPPLGGGSTANSLQKQMSNCSPTSLLSVLVRNVWSTSQQNAWTTQILQGVATLIADGFLANPDSSQNYMYPVDDAFVNPGTFDNTTSVVSYVPLGPHDAFLPGANGPNVRPVSSASGNQIIINNVNEQSLFDDNTILCIHNDGQVDPTAVAYVLNTAFTGLGVPEGTLVTNIQFGPSKPAGLYNAVYLTLSNAIENSLGPFVWFFQETAPLGPSQPQGSDEPLPFNSGTYFHGTLNDLFGSIYDKTIALSSVSQEASEALNTALYAMMPHIFWPTTNESNTVPTIIGTWFPDIYTMPSSEPGGPSYLQDLWPIQPNTGNNLSFVLPSFLQIRVFVRPVYAPSQISLGNRSISKTFEYTGAPQYFDVPPWATTMNVYCYGAGAYSSNPSLAGSNGSFVRATFNTIQSQQLVILVGQGGNQLAPVDKSCCGGLDAAKQMTLGGGLSGVYIDRFPGAPLIVAAGGGSAGSLSAGVLEPKADTFSTRKYGDGIVGALDTGFNDSFFNALDSNSGAGGSGLRKGSQGQPGHGGAAGLSFVPKNGTLSGQLSRQKYFSSGIGLGTTTAGIPGNGRVIIEINY